MLSMLDKFNQLVIGPSGRARSNRQRFMTPVVYQGRVLSEVLSAGNNAVFILGMFSGSMKWLLTQTRSR